MALPTWVAAGAINGSIGVPAPALPTGHTTNDILVLVIETANEAAAIPTGYTEFPDSPQGTGTAAGGQATRLTTCWKRDNGSETAPTLTDSGDHTIALIFAIRGCATSGDPFDVTSGGTAAISTSISITGDTTTVADCLIAALATRHTDQAGADFSSEANTDLANLTERVDDGSTAGNGGGIVVYTGEKATAGAYGATTATLGTTAVKAFQTIAFKPAGGTNATATPSTVAATASVPAPTLKGAATGLPSTVAAVSTVPSATAKGAGKAAPSTIAATASVPAPTVTGTVGVLTVVLQPADFVFDSPNAITQIDLTIFPGPADFVFDTPALTVDLVSFATPSTVAATASVPTPTVKGNATAAPPTVAVVASVPAPTVLGAVAAVATPSTINVVAHVPDPAVVVGGAAFAMPSTIEVVASIPAPTLAGTATATPSTVNAVAVVPVPTVQASADTAAATVQATASVPAPVVTGSATATPATVQAVATVPAPVSAAPGTATPATVVVHAFIPPPTALGTFVGDRCVLSGLRRAARREALANRIQPPGRVRPRRVSAGLSA